MTAASIDFYTVCACPRGTFYSDKPPSYQRIGMVKGAVALNREDPLFLGNLLSVGSYGLAVSKRTPRAAKSFDLLQM